MLVLLRHHKVAAYELADWLDLGDSEAIEARLRELGHRVVHDQRPLREYEC